MVLQAGKLCFFHRFPCTAGANLIASFFLDCVLLFHIIDLFYLIERFFIFRLTVHFHTGRSNHDSFKLETGEED